MTLHAVVQCRGTMTDLEDELCFRLILNQITDSGVETRYLIGIHKDRFDPMALAKPHMKGHKKTYRWSIKSWTQHGL